MKYVTGKRILPEVWVYIIARNTLSERMEDSQKQYLDFTQNLHYNS